MVASQGKDNKQDLGQDHRSDYQLEPLTAEIGAVLAGLREPGHQEENILPALAHDKEHRGSQEKKGGVGEGPISEKAGVPSVVSIV